MDSWIFDPLRELRKMQKRMAGLFDENFDETMKIREPLVDVKDKGHEIEVTIELPGVKKNNINLNVTENSLNITAKASTEEKEERKGYYYHERGYQTFKRIIPLPTEVLGDKAKAEFNNGILTVTIPKKHPEEKPEGFKVKID